MAHQIVIKVEDVSMLTSLREVLGQMQGVTVLEDCDMEDKQSVVGGSSAYEKSLEDIEAGRINKYETPEELFKEMGI